MKRIISVIAVAALMAMMLMVMAVPALAKGQPNTKINNPYASVNDTFIFTYQAPPADGGDPPKSDAKGRTPGIGDSGAHKQVCLKGADSC
jgi:hypothetical protein